MLTWHSFLQSVMFFVRSISVKLTKKHYRSSSVLMSGAVVIAVVAFSANGFGGGGKNAMAAPRTVESLEADEEPETEALLEGSSFVTEAKIQFGPLLKYGCFRFCLIRSQFHLEHTRLKLLWFILQITADTVIPALIAVLVHIFIDHDFHLAGRAWHFIPVRPQRFPFLLLSNA